MDGSVIAFKYMSKYLKNNNLNKSNIRCSIQDGNMGGNYLRNYFFYKDDKIGCFISEMDYFDKTNEFNSILMEKFVWLRIKVSLVNNDIDMVL